MNFDPRFEGFDLSEGVPEYTTDERQPYGYADSNISANIRKLYIYMPSCDKIDRSKKDYMFKGVLETLHWREAQLLVAVKNRTLSDLFPSITEAVVREAFPDMLPPLGDDDLIEAAAVIERHLEQGIYNWKQYTKDEIIKLALNKRVIFKFPEHAERLGIAHLADGYEEPETTYDPEIYLNFKVEKTVFGKSSEIYHHIALAEFNPDGVRGLKIRGSHVVFDDLAQAKALGIADIDRRVIADEKDAAKQAIFAANKNRRRVPKTVTK